MNRHSNWNSYPLRKEKQNGNRFGRVCQFLIKLSIPDNPATSALLGIYPSKMKTYVCAHTSSVYIWLSGALTDSLAFFGSSFSNFIRNPHNMQTIQLSWMDKHIVFHPYNGILCSDTKEQTNNTGKNMDKSEIHFIKWKEAKSKNFIRCNFNYMAFRKR